MSLSTITTISSHPFNKKIGTTGWGPVNFIFPSDLTSYAVNSNTITYSGGSGATAFKNGTYLIAAQCSFPTTLPWNMFDVSTTTRWFSGLINQSNVQINGSTITYDQAAYDWTTGNYLGGRANGTATFNTNGYQGEYFQIQYPFQFIVTKVYLKTSGGNEFARAPKILYIFGSTDGTSWTLVDTITTAVTNNNEYSYTVANTTKYTYYRFLANKVTGGNNTGTCYSLVSFKTEGTAWSL
jgi:hypothetical protein